MHIIDPKVDGIYREVVAACGTASMFWEALLL